MEIITFNQFAAVELRVGTVTRAEAFPEARKPAIKLWVDLALRLALNKLPPNYRALQTGRSSRKAGGGLP